MLPEADGSTALHLKNEPEDAVYKRSREKALDEDFNFSGSENLRNGEYNKEHAWKDKEKKRNNPNRVWAYTECNQHVAIADSIHAVHAWANTLLFEVAARFLHRKAVGRETAEVGFPAIETKARNHVIA